MLAGDPAAGAGLIRVYGSVFGGVARDETLYRVALGVLDRPGDHPPGHPILHADNGGLVYRGPARVFESLAFRMRHVLSLSPNISLVGFYRAIKGLEPDTRPSRRR